ncbi:hypothetical protein NBO_1240g0001 [Nosema bombycis CQ1]|uniref:Uncharacterized protein n=1 Tax=Nosema bombycis (strain CQ1 / CVCC 102059) TaxID=578461 RepID=R0KL89_NOSB1|nr:hypothetical protein NBO_1240g0001 [Nosema bombycis CQ1]|eukprot:EOB11371.1 hypothetical protein NBO_1240g0001 [Nosema bombycis CQ1]
MIFYMFLLIKLIFATTNENEETKEKIAVKSKQESDKKDSKLIVAELKENYKGKSPFEETHFGFVFPEGTIPREIYPGDEYSGKIVFPGYTLTYPGDNFFKPSKEGLNMVNKLPASQKIPLSKDPQKIKTIYQITRVILHQIYSMQKKGQITPI